MGLNWPGVSTTGGNVDAEEQARIKSLLNDVADRVALELPKLGLPLHASPLWRPWSLIVAVDSEKVLCAFSALSGGIASIRWLDESSQVFTEAAFVRAVKEQVGQEVDALIVLPRSDAAAQAEQVQVASLQHVIEVERSMRLRKLGDLTGVQHLEPYLRSFLEDHPDPDRNAFVMMRFMKSDQLNEAYRAIKDAFAERGVDAVRADDRDYTGGLWSNIEVYMTCCMLGVAIFEDIEQRDFNPNVSLELGYMLGASATVPNPQGTATPRSSRRCCAPPV